MKLDTKNNPQFKQKSNTSNYKNKSKQKRHQQTHLILKNMESKEI